MKKTIQLWTLLCISLIPAGIAYAGDMGERSSSNEVSERSKALWTQLLHNKPYPYRMPLPPEERTPLDGLYTKYEVKEGEPVPCKRCPDYVIQGGTWKLSMDKGVFRIFHPITGWKNIGSYIVAGNQLVLANDPVCHDVIGLYTWEREERQLIITLIYDPCGIQLRAKNLTNLPWLSCQPPTIEAAATDHGPKPPGCE